MKTTSISSWALEKGFKKDWETQQKLSTLYVDG
jgi:hypothetical protein